MIEFFLDWGYDVDPKSSISGYYKYECLVVEYHNTLTFSPLPKQTIEFEGHIITVELKDGDLADVFSVQPAYGWIIESGSNPSQVQEKEIGTLVLCQVTLS